MDYPQLSTKIDILHRKYVIDPSKIADVIKRDKSTAWRWLSKQANRLPPDQQGKLVRAICEALSQKGIELNEKMFRGDNILSFCLEARLSKFEAAHFCGFNLPVPDVFIDGIFDLSKDPAKRFGGHYLQYRPDRFHTNGSSYIQSCATISPDQEHRAKYEGSWSDQGARHSYEGFVFLVGTQVSIVGQCTNTGHDGQLEIWWCAVRSGGIDGNGKQKPMAGYISDFTGTGKLFTDRIVLVRCTEEELQRVCDLNESYVDRPRLVQMIGEDMAKYLDEWMSVPM